ncbi:MAG: glycosyltransferase [Ignavibacteriales bacterium]|nr:glycosyltransferase [Ignavibacteriales bacterium]
MAAITPLVSIITVCLNSASTIKQTIESVINQSYSNIEYIVIDGGSIDGTLHIIGEYKNRISHLVSEKDNGISDAFNKGLRIAKGEYIQLLNADDLIPRDKIANSVSELISHPECGFVFGDIILQSGKGEDKRIPGNPDYRQSISRIMRRINHPTVLARRSLYENYGLFDVRWKIAMDYEWHLRIDKKGEYGFYSPEIVVMMSPSGVSNINTDAAIREVRDISIMHGYPKMSAQLYYLGRIFKNKIYSVLGLR